MPRRRRIIGVSATLLAAPLLLAACNDDGRTLRPAGVDQTATVSTTVADSEPAASDPAFDTVGPIDSPGVTINLPAEEPSPYTVQAPWADAAAIDPRYTCDGEDIAPALTWSSAPEGTVEIAITMTDDLAPEFEHWTMSGLSATSTALAEGEVPVGAEQGRNGRGLVGYAGPCPPPGITHTYRITVFYLGQQLELGDGADGRDLRLAIESASIAAAEVGGNYSRA